MNVLKKIKITKITSLLYDFDNIELEAIYNALIKFSKEANRYGLQSRNNKNA